MADVRVLFPEPDSPAIPNDSPKSMLKDTLSTALIVLFRR